MSNFLENLKNISTIEKVKFLIKDSIIYGGLNAITKVFSIFLTPMLARLLTKEEFGNMDILNPLLSIGATIIVFGMDSAVARFYYNTENPCEQKEIISNGFWFQIFIAVFFSSFLLVFNEEFLKFYLGSSYSLQQENFFNILILILIFSTPIRFAQNVLRWLFHRKQFLILSIGYVLANFFCITLFVFFFKNKLYSFYLAQLLPSLFFLFLSILYLKKYLIFKINISLMKKMLIYGSPLLIVAFIPSIVPALDKFAINKYLGLSEVANYGIGTRIASIVAIPILSINTAFGPFILGLYKEKEAQSLFNNLLSIIVVLLSVLVMILVMVSPYIIRIIATNSYLNGIIVIVPLCFYYLLEMQRSIGASGIDLSMKTYWNLILYPLSTGILYFFIILFTPKFGIFGTANALFVSALLNFIIFTYVASKLYPIRYEILNQTVLIFTGYLLALFIQFNSKEALSVFVNLLCIIIYVLVSYKLFLTNELKDIINQKSRNLVNQKKYFFRK